MTRHAPATNSSGSCAFAVPSDTYAGTRSLPRAIRILESRGVERWADKNVLAKHGILGCESSSQASDHYLMEQMQGEETYPEAAAALAQKLIDFAKAPAGGSILGQFILDHGGILACG